LGICKQGLQPGKIELILFFLTFGLLVTPNVVNIAGGKKATNQSRVFLDLLYAPIKLIFHFRKVLPNFFKGLNESIGKAKSLVYFVQ